MIKTTVAVINLKGETLHNIEVPSIELRLSDIDWWKTAHDIWLKQRIQFKNKKRKISNKLKEYGKNTKGYNAKRVCILTTRLL